MKRLPILILVSSILAGTALVATGGADATVLCPKNETACVEPFPEGTEFELTTSKLSMATNLANVNCAATLKGKTTSEGGESEPVTAEVTSLSFSSCVVEGSAQTCTVSAINLPYAGKFETITSPNGSFSFSSGGSGNPGATYVCGTIINCSFSVATATLSVTGGEPATAKANGIALTTGTGSKCPKSAKWNGEFSFKLPNAGKLFLPPARPKTKICGAEELNCAAPKAAGTKLKGVAGDAEIELPRMTGTPTKLLTCVTSTIEGQSEAVEGAPLRMNFLLLSFGECSVEGVGCESVAATNPPVLSTALIAQGNKRDGTWRIPLKLTLKCPAFETGGLTRCEYEGPVSLQVTWWKSGENRRQRPASVQGRFGRELLPGLQRRAPGNDHLAWQLRLQRTGSRLRHELTGRSGSIGSG